jgi:hypothetical protein
MFSFGAGTFAPPEPVTYEVGDKVEKVKGYQWPGEVRSVFTSLAGQTRIVVECTVPEVAGALHIYSPEQLRKVQ